MVAIRLDKFAGMVPRLSDRLQGPEIAALASNARLISGKLVGFNDLLFDEDRLGKITSDTRKSFVARKPDGTEVLIKSNFVDADILPSPLVADTYDRHYRSEPNRSVVYQPLSNWDNGDGDTGLGWEGGDLPFKLGVPRPTIAPGVAFTAGTGGDPQTRAYVYTYVTAFGEEGPPSPPGIFTGTDADDATWDVSGLPTTNPDSGDPPYAAAAPIVAWRLYRTVVGTNNEQFGAPAQFYFVVEKPIPGNANYTDTAPDAEIVFNNVLPSTTWDPPPFGLQGIVAHSSGFFAGFVGRDVYLSEAFQPHAWPRQYMVSVAEEIIGLAAFQDTIVVLSEGNPVTLNGVDPGGLQKIILPNSDPCVSKRSIVVDEGRVFYASPHGLMRVTPFEAINTTEQLVDALEWRSVYVRPEMICGRYDEYYLAFNTQSGGWGVAFNNPQSTFTRFSNLSGISGVDIDPVNGDLLVLRDGSVYLWDRLASSSFRTRWTSKLLVTEREVNLKAIQLHFDHKFRTQEEDPTVLPDDSGPKREYNAARFAEGPLEVLDQYPIDLPPEPTPFEKIFYEPPRGPLNGVPLYPIFEFGFGGEAGPTEALVTITADFRDVWTGVIKDDEIHLLPAGYRASRFQVHLSVRGTLEACYLATSAGDLQKV